MPHSVTIKSLPRAFEKMKALEAEGLEWGEDHRLAAREALMSALQGRLSSGADLHLEAMARHGEADRRNGGYSRVLKAGFRYGDSAPMAVIELVDRDESEKGKDSGPVQISEDAAGPEGLPV